jgi:hypothetical protein
MGQYGNQPDFGTIVIALEDVGLGSEFPPSAIYIGTTDDNNGYLEVQPVGNAPGDTVVIHGVSNGTFLPIVVTKIISTNGIDLDTILLYR